MRHLAHCMVCARQFDCTNHKAGERFHCLCGELITVPERRSHEAAVVRCSSCGGARAGSDSQCDFCGAGFTLHEQDLHTVCPGCLARISDRAKFCHHCGIAIAVAGDAGDWTNRSCPGCGDKVLLSSRSLPESDFNMLECNRCAGLWLNQEVFLALERRMLELAASGITDEHRDMAGSLPRQQRGDQNLYRKCPECRVIMHRRNYGPGSGIVIDQCHQHGFWFDARELGVILRWIRSGGLLASQKRRSAMDRDSERLARLLKDIDERRRKAMGRVSESGHWKW
jgi:Zn-finger nucleic acid-binding protein